MLIPVLSSKQTGYEEVLAELVAEAVLATMPSPSKPASVTVDNVRVAKLVGGNPLDSQVVRGVVVQRDTDGSIKHVEKAKVAVFGCSIEASSSETKGVVVIKNAEELKAYNKGEERLMEETIKAIADRFVFVLEVWAGSSPLPPPRSPPLPPFIPPAYTSLTKKKHAHCPLPVPLLPPTPPSPTAAPRSWLRAGVSVR